MTHKDRQYFEPDVRSVTGYRWYMCKGKLKTYPHALRFKTRSDICFYFKARKDFIQSTKIPASCDACPLAHEMCDLSIRYGVKYQCRRIWCKIWEYVK